MTIACVAGALGGCSASMIGIESLSSDGGNFMHLVTFVTFLLAPISALWADPTILKHKFIPLTSYILLVFMFFIVSVVNNQTVYFDMPFPLFIILRSGTLVASVLLSSILLRRVYSWTKIIAVLAVTVGLIVFTLASSNYQPPVGRRAEFMWIDYLPWSRFTTGILAQLFCIFVSAYLGIKQESLFGIYGKKSDEMMFYVHILSLPLFAFVWTDITKAIRVIFESEKQIIAGVQLPVSSLMMKMIAVSAFQIICVRSIYRLSSAVSNLSLNMILALRKFLNLFLSAAVFGNEFNVYHFGSSVLIIGGSMMFYDVWGQFKHYYGKKKAVKTE
uniref:UAA transporter n=1 Tax=Panagrellus redivivus TaxID=6233 RepID=A0A7E4WC76_PANRE